MGGTMSRPDDDSSPSSREAAFTRRSLLIGAATTVVGVAIGCRRGAPPRRKGTIVGPGRFVNTDNGKMSFVLCLFDLDGPGSRSIDMDFFGHGLALDPRAPGRAVMFEKKGPGCCELDLRAGSVLRPISTSKERAFYGHGAFSRDGAVLFATENNLDTKDGLICVRDARTFRELGQFPTYGKSPHDCHLIDEGRTLAITNGGSAVGEKEGAPSVTFVDARSEKLLEKLEFRSPRINAGHLAITKKRDLVTISAPRDGLPKTEKGGVTLRVGNGPFVTMSEPAEVVERMIGESLSLCVDEPSQVVGVTNPDGNVVTFWDLTRQRFVKRLELPAPRGLTKTLDEEYLVLSYGAGTLTLVEPSTLEPVSHRRVDKSTLSGSHIFNWDAERA